MTATTPNRKLTDSPGRLALPHTRRRLFRRTINEGTENEMILTTPSCPLNDYMKRDIRETLNMLLPALPEVEVEILREPSWSPDRMDPAARETLGI